MSPASYRTAPPRVVILTLRGRWWREQIEAPATARQTYGVADGDGVAVLAGGVLAGVPVIALCASNALLIASFRRVWAAP
jgi:hypothetical protein